MVEGCIVEWLGGVGEVVRVWDNAIELAGVVVPVVIAIVVALMVSGRDDRRQREAERRAVQRETVIALQDGWLAQGVQLTEALRLIQTHQFFARQSKEELAAAVATNDRGEPQVASRAELEERWERLEARAEEVNRSGDEQSAAIVRLQVSARGIELLESRVSSEPVKAASREMRECAEMMIRDLGRQGGSRYESIRCERYQPACDRFIAAGYRVLADIEARERETTVRWSHWLQRIRRRPEP